MTAARSALRDPGVRAVWLAVAAAATLTTLRLDQHGRVTITLGTVLFSERFGEVGFTAAAVAGGIIGAGARQHGTARTRWTAGEDRAQVLGGTVAAGALGAVLVPPVWWATSLLIGSWFVHGAGPSLDAMVQVTAWAVGASALCGAMGVLVGFLVARTRRAVLIIALGSLAFTSDALGALDAAPAWLGATNPMAAVHLLCVAGTRSVLLGGGVDDRATVVAAVASALWLLGLGAWCLRTPLVRVPQPMVVPRAVPVALVAVAVVALGALGPHAAAPGVRWPLRPDWRHAVAEGRSSRQVADRWLTCRQRGARSGCSRFERPGGVAITRADARMLATATSHQLEFLAGQRDPRDLDVVLTIPPYRSGDVVVDRAGLRLRLTGDGRGGYLVAAAEIAAMGTSGR